MWTPFGVAGILIVYLVFFSSHTSREPSFLAGMYPKMSITIGHSCFPLAVDSYPIMVDGLASPSVVETLIDIQVILGLLSEFIGKLTLLLFRTGRTDADIIFGHSSTMAFLSLCDSCLLVLEII